MAHYDTKFWIILAVIIAVIVFLVILYTTNQKPPPPPPQPVVPKPPLPCPRPSPMGNTYAVIVPGVGTIVSWDPVASATEFTVFQGDGSVSQEVFENRVRTTDDYLWFSDEEDSKFYFVCPSNPCGQGQCSPVVVSDYGI